MSSPLHTGELNVIHLYLYLSSSFSFPDYLVIRRTKVPGDENCSSSVSCACVKQLPLVPSSFVYTRDQIQRLKIWSIFLQPGTKFASFDLGVSVKRSVFFFFFELKVIVTFFLRIVIRIKKNVYYNSKNLVITIKCKHYNINVYYYFFNIT